MFYLKNFFYIFLNLFFSVLENIIFEHPFTTLFIMVSLYELKILEFHFEISGNNDNDEHPQSIESKSIL